MGWRRGAFSRTKALWIVAALLGVSAPALAIEPGIADYKHMGVASCATSVCHGKLAPQSDKDVALERISDLAAGGPARAGVSDPGASRIQAHRRQSRAAQRRPRPRSASIAIPTTCRPTSAARNFRSATAWAAKACHGGSEKWLESHAAESRYPQGQRGSRHVSNRAAVEAGAGVPGLSPRHQGSIRHARHHGRGPSAPELRAGGLHHQPAGAFHRRRRLCPAQGQDRGHEPVGHRPARDHPALSLAAANQYVRPTPAADVS